MNFDEIIENRYSVRKFKDEKVSEELIEKVLETGRIAPSAGNEQPTVVFVLDEDKIKKLEEHPNAKIHPVVFRTKQVLLICYDKNIEMKRPHDDFTFGIVDSSITTTYMMLKISELGLGSTWIGLFHPKLIKEILELPENYEVSSMLAFGYLVEDSRPSKLHNERKPMEEFRME